MELAFSVIIHKRIYQGDSLIMFISSLYIQILQLLYPFFSCSNSKTNITDNACGCVARMILKAPDSVPLEHVLPPFFANLPLKSDFEENEPVFQCIFYLLQIEHAAVRICYLY